MLVLLSDPPLPGYLGNSCAAFKKLCDLGLSLGLQSGKIIKRGAENYKVELDLTIHIYPTEYLAHIYVSCV